MDRTPEPHTWNTIERVDGAMSYTYGESGPDPVISSACLREIALGQGGGGGNPLPFSGSDRTPRIHDGMTRGDYEFYRPAEAIPKRHRDIVAACDEVYHHVGILRNIIDLMSDFGSHGIEIFHPNKTKQSRYRHWFRKVGGKERSERFLNLLYRHGNVIVRRTYSDMNAGDLKDLERGIASRLPDEPEDTPYVRGPKVFKHRIPIQYSFLNPTAVHVMGNDLAMFAGQPHYALRLPEALLKIIRNPKTDEDIRLVALLPDYIVRPVKAGKKMIPLDPAKIQVFHYKKDDWEQWAYPMSYSILADLKLYEKNKLADMSALDGAVSHIRLWTLGIPELRIQPGPAAFARLREQLQMASGGGSLDLIWDKSLSLQETSTDVYNFLGSKKYEPVLQAIYAGLGIPQALGGGKEGGTTTTALSLKTLIERLQYGRDLLKKFWENELNILQQAFDDRNPAQIHFENMSLSDEANEKMLWIHLIDRNIISEETLREKFGTIPDVEMARIRREYAGREEDVVPEKLGPFNEPGPNPEASAQKAVQTGLLAPSQTKMKVRPKKPGDTNLIDRQQEMDQQKINLQREQMDADQKQALRRQIKKKGQPGQGRPQGSKDKQKRKKKVVTPQAGASLMATLMWARGAQRTIANAVTPAYLDRCKKKSMRHLTVVEADDFEDLKFRILCSMEPVGNPDAEMLSIALSHPPAPHAEAEDLVRAWLTASESKPTVDELREMQATAYAIINTEGDDDGKAESDA